MTPQLARIKAKLADLERSDTARNVFGAFKHTYRLNQTATAAEISRFEQEYGIVLPEGYRSFLQIMGNGGAGPYYGLESLEDSLYDDLDYKTNRIDPSKPFPLTEPWNMDLGDPEEDEAVYSNKEKEYFDPQWTNGLLRLSNFGCGVSINLVVNGAEYGKVWVDDRCNDGGLFPDHYFGNEERIGFLDWYERWLDKGLQQVNHLPPTKIKPPSKWWQRLFGR